MKHTFNRLALSLIVLLLALVNSDCAKSKETIPTDTIKLDDKYTLLWSDEFDGNVINTTNWNFETGNLKVNNEKQYYKAENAKLLDGNLVITALKEETEGQPYSSARLNTMGKVSVKYGRVEARIKMPQGKGLWPAFWLLGANVETVGWPKCGEIDIMEHVNDTDTIYGTLHWDNNGYATYGKTIVANSADYHVYAIEWDNQSIKWYMDDQYLGSADIADSINSTNEFHDPFFIILNFAVAGDFPGQTVDETKIPASMLVDYVRVYKAN